ncbi:DUF1223 domain-containing protein [Chenggangzhangella methanolivorans]|uniref:DUF1223 domain-containing protein n=1 Tax=Chenggangzhangella methanolivorans TaxID=1437009 RepID=UPI0021BD929D|nr:DUF1223 domain-containing protein [Chenggangzhangella methanolivorans]
MVELFTSQGCSSCPPANANLIQLADRRDVLALSYSVTYWDRLGWKDSFGKAEFTRRQADYVPKLGLDGPFTPHMVVDGRFSAVGQDLNEVLGLVARAGDRRGPEVEISAGKVAIGAGTPQLGGADVWLVRFDPNTVRVAVGRGENSGRTLPHAHVVHELRRLGGWTGEAATLPLPPAVDKLQTAILVQARDGGPIVAAARR